MPKTAIVIRHVHFEDIGSFETVLAEAGYRPDYRDIGCADLRQIDPVETDLLIVLGGPIGVYEADIYPFLNDEIALLRRRLAAARPTFGICLGAQLMAAALGAAVKPTGLKEIGFSPLRLTTAGRNSVLRHLADVPVLHWHGDMFDIPGGAALLAQTDLCPHQAFAIGRNILGVQFHPEAEASGFERWLIGHAAELAQAKIDVAGLRRDAERLGGGLREAGRTMFAEWLRGLT